MAMSFFSPAAMPRTSNAYGLPVQPVTRVQQVTSALATQRIYPMGGAQKTEEPFQVLANGDFTRGSGVVLAASGKEPAIDPVTAQRVWSA